MKDSPSIDIGEVIDRVAISPLQWKVFALCGIVALLDGFDTQAVAFAVPLMAKSWGAPLASFSLAFSAGLLGLCLGSLLIGPLADRYGRKAVIAWSTAAFGTASLATVLVADVASLVALRFITGLGLGGAIPNLIAMVAEYAPKGRRALLITASYCGFPLGGALGGVIASTLVPHYGWEAIFWVGGICPLLLLPVLFASLPESPRFLVLKGGAGEQLSAILNAITRGTRRFQATHAFTMDDVSGQGQKALGGRRAIATLFADGRAGFTLLLWAIFFCNLLVMYFLFSWLPSVLQNAGLPLQVAINSVVILNLGGIIGGLAIGQQVDRIGPFRTLLVTFAAGAVAVLLIGVSDQPAVVLTSAFFSGVLIIGSQFAMNALAAAFYPTAARSTGVGWALGIGRVGSVVGPLLGGALVHAGFQADTVLAVAAGPAAVSAACVLALLLQHKRAAAGERVADEPVPSVAAAGTRTER